MAARQESEVKSAYDIPTPKFVALELKNTPDYKVPIIAKHPYKRTAEDYSPEQLAIRQKVMEAFPDKPVMWDIAKAESQYQNICNFMYKSHGGENGTRTACGVYMITKTTWKQNKCEGDVSGRFDVDKNLACAKVISTNNPSLSDWDESSNNW